MFREELNLDNFQGDFLNMFTFSWPSSLCNTHWFKVNLWNTSLLTLLNVIFRYNPKINLTFKMKMWLSYEMQLCGFDKRHETPDMEQMNDKPASSQIMFLLRLENWKHDVPWSVAKPLWFIFRYGVRTQVFVTALGIQMHVKRWQKFGFFHWPSMSC